MKKLFWGVIQATEIFFQEPLCKTVRWQESKQSKAKQQISHDVYLPTNVRFRLPSSLPLI